MPSKRADDELLGETNTCLTFLRALWTISTDSAYEGVLTALASDPPTVAIVYTQCCHALRLMADNFHAENEAFMANVSNISSIVCWGKINSANARHHARVLELLHQAVLAGILQRPSPAAMDVLLDVCNNLAGFHQSELLGLTLPVMDAQPVCLAMTGVRCMCTALHSALSTMPSHPPDLSSHLNALCDVLICLREKINQLSDGSLDCLDAATAATAVHTAEAAMRLAIVLPGLWPKLQLASEDMLSLIGLIVTYLIQLSEACCHFAFNLAAVPPELEAAVPSLLALMAPCMHALPLLFPQGCLDAPWAAKLHMELGKAVCISAERAIYQLELQCDDRPADLRCVLHVANCPEASSDSRITCSKKPRVLLISLAAGLQACARDCSGNGVVSNGALFQPRGVEGPTYLRCCKCKLRHAAGRPQPPSPFRGMGLHVTGRVRDCMQRGHAHLPPLPRRIPQRKQHQR